MEEYQMDPEGVAGFVTTIVIISFVVSIISIAGMWKTFQKAGKPGWAAIVPIYNTIVILEIVGKPLWWIILLLIPFVNIVVGIMVIHLVSASFGKGAGMTVLLLLLPFIGWPMLGFGDAQYQGPAGATAVPA
jgi:hypothetical protein